MRVLTLNAFIPNNQVAKEIASLGSGKLPDELLHNKAHDSELSFLRVVKPQYTDHLIVQGSPEFYQASLNNLNKLFKSGILSNYQSSIFYYKQIHHSGENLEGWVVGIGAEEYTLANIKKHENTLTAKENRLIEHIRVLNSIGEPVLLTQSLPLSLQSYAVKVTSNVPVFDLNDEYENQHLLWLIEPSDDQAEIINHLSGLSSLYIADGHHRVAATSRYLLEHPELSQQSGIMSLILDEPQLLIKPFYRLCSNVDIDEFAKRVEDLGMLIEDITQVKDSHQLANQVLCITASHKYLLSLPAPAESLNARERLDVSRLETEVLLPLFGIEDSSHDNRISFLRGDNSIDFVKQLLWNGQAEIAFLVSPNTMSEIKDIADAGLIMPPKSTFIEPKLMSGMIIESYNR